MSDIDINEPDPAHRRAHASIRDEAGAQAHEDSSFHCDERERKLQDRIRILEVTLANEARIVEAQANLDTDSKYIGKASKGHLAASVERMRRYASAEPIEGNLVYNGDPSREYRSLLHKRRGHESTGWSCQQCYDEGLR